VFGKTPLFTMLTVAVGGADVPEIGSVAVGRLGSFDVMVNVALSGPVVSAG